MLEIRRDDKINYEKIPVDPYWNIGDKRELKMHRIHSYPAKFPAFITSKSLDFIEEKTGKKPEKIADIFCGCGTTALEACNNNIEFWGCDISPVATLIAKVKSTKYNSKTIEKYHDMIVKHYKNSEKKDVYNLANERLKYWYETNQYTDLLTLKNSIYECIPQNSKYRQYFMCAFSNILKLTSKWLTKSIKPQIDPNKKAVDVLTSFCTQLKMMIKANNEQYNLTSKKVTIKTGDILNNKWKIPEVDLIVTSPPYVTSYEYADLHQLSSLWLDYVEDYRALREGTIGSLYHNYAFDEKINFLNQTGDEIVSQLIEQQKSKAKSVAKYFLDMQVVAKKAYEMLNIGGYALFVIGNTEFKEVKINNAKHLVESLYDAGFKKVFITKRKISNKFLTPYRDKNGRFTKRDLGRKIYSEEYIVIGEKHGKE